MLNITLKDGSICQTEQTTVEAFCRELSMAYIAMLAPPA